jgi:hypothetical protein
MGRGMNCWFNQERLMIISKKTWKEKWLEKEKGRISDSDRNSRDGRGHESAEINMVFQLLVICPRGNRNNLD